MPIVLLVAAAAIVGGAVLAALGRAGEMAIFVSDATPFGLGQVTATDVALLRPPLSLWGYNAPATEEALRVIARAMTVRDVEIATLRRELADAQSGRSASRPIPASRPAEPSWTRHADGGGWPAPVAGMAEPSPLVNPTEPSPLVSPTEPSPVPAPAEPGPTEPSPETWRQQEQRSGE
ncbi:MAG TPA: hypothetical protein VIX86_05600 [Streptosporangiaceae bacterium]